MFDSGIVDEREMQKLRREAEANHRQGWEYAYVFDVSDEERAKGKTHETGSLYFTTDKRRITVLDAPGHKAFVPSMIGGAAQADVAVLVISARTGEFETGFEKGGQTREHAVLVKTCGVRHMICLINKLDDVDWSQERYEEVVGKMRPFLKSTGYDEKQGNLFFMPVSGLSGEGLRKEKPATRAAAFYSGVSFLEYIDALDLPMSHTDEDTVCMPVAGKYKEDGKVCCYGKIESGGIAVGDEIQFLPTTKKAIVESILVEQTEIEKAFLGDNVHLRVKGADEDDIHVGFIVTIQPSPLRAVDYFQARIVVLEVKNILSAGSKVMMHIHAAEEEVTIHKLLAKVDRKTSEVKEKDPACVKSNECVIARIEVSRTMCVAAHKDFDKLGRFMLREEGKTIALGVIMRLYDSTKDNIKTKGQ
jgi:peptide chain release factor subunit 3